MKYKVLIPSDITSAGKDYLKEHDCEVTVLNDSSVENICRNVADADGILARTEKYPAEVFEAAKKLKVIGRHGAGVDNVDLEAAFLHGVTVCNTPLAPLNSVAEHTIMMMAACAKHTVAQDRACRRGDFESRNRLKGIELEGKTLGLIGCGNIGQMVAKKAAYGFGMHVIGYDKYAQPSRLLDVIGLVDSMDEIYEKADFISLHVPLLKETKGMVGKEAFHKMKNSAFLINCARGGIVKEQELYEALKSGELAGAGLDVFESELSDANNPIDTDNPLYTLDCVVVSAHNAGLTKEASDRMGLQAAQGIVEVLSGRKPTWPVNKK